MGWFSRNAKKESEKTVLYDKANGIDALKEKKEDVFSLEYYPLANRYYAKLNDKYLMRHWASGRIELYDASDFYYANSYYHREGAENLIKLYKEQRDKINVINIPIL